MRFDLDGADLSERVVAEAAPSPILRPTDEPAPHGVAMEVVQLLPELGFGVDIEVVIARLPEVLPAADEDPRDRLLDRLNGRGKIRALGFPYQQVHMLGHYHVAS